MSTVLGTRMASRFEYLRCVEAGGDGIPADMFDTAVNSICKHLVAKVFPVEEATELHTLIGASPLPDEAKKKVKDTINARVVFDPADATGDSGTKQYHKFLENYASA